MKRVKVSCTHPRKAFFEKVLMEWKESIEDRNFRYVVSKAHVNLKNFPLEVSTVKDLKNVKGIGDFIAQKLEASWESFCSQRLSVPTVADVKELRKGDGLQFLNSAPSTSGVHHSKGGGDAAQATVAAKRKRPAVARLPSAQGNTLSTKSQEKVTGEAGPSGGRGNLIDLAEPETLDSNTVSLKVPRVDDEKLEADEDNNTESLPHYSFADQNAEVILLVDNREHHGGRKGHSVCDHFVKMGYTFELRSLSVGDYMWVQRLADGTELVLDYIVERKTFDDLSKSIRQGRYEEQKQRLLVIGLRHIVYVVEGNGVPDAAIEQALATTQVANGFLVHRTSNVKETAQFLGIITKRLLDKARTQNELGMTFEAFQKNAKKTQRRCVSDIFLRQLTVCPQMSIPKAALIVNRFPSFTALAEFYKSSTPDNRETLLADTVPGISKALSKQMSKFFQHI